MKKIIIKLIQFITSVFQIKGVPKILLLFRKYLFNNISFYKCYNDIQIKINPNVGFHCLNVLNYGGYETVKLFEKYLNMDQESKADGCSAAFRLSRGCRIMAPSTI